MTVHRLWVVALFCVSGFVGCARISTHSLFSRRPSAVSSEDEFARRVIADANRLAARGDLNGARRLLEQLEPASEESDAAANLAGSSRDTKPVQVSRRELRHSEPEEETPASGGGQFDVSSRGGFDERFSIAEAPAPKRRINSVPELTSMPAGDSLATAPREFAPQANWTASPPYPNDAIAYQVAGRELPSQPLLNAECVQRPERRDSGIIPAAGTRALPQMPPDASNPWNRFQNVAESPGAVAAEPIRQPSAAYGHIDSLNNFAPATWPQAPLPGPNSSLVSSSGTTPELWPRAPRMVMPDSNGPPPAAISQPFGRVADPTSATIPPNVHLLGGASPVPGQMPIGSQNLAGTSVRDALPNSAGTEFSAPELDRLIVQTAVESNSMKPGDTPAERQAYLRKHVQLRVLQVLAGQTDRALQPIPGLEAVDQEFWQQLLWGLANYFDVHGMPDAAERATQTIAQLQSAALRLQQKARLELRHLTFCNKITGFGTYQRFARDQFTPGQPVLLYSEIGHFTSEPTADGQFRTLMKSTIDILEGGAEGRIVESIPFAPSEDRCRNHRRDYFHSYEFAIPQSIRPGPHVLQLTVEDQLGRKTSSARVSFTVE